MKILVVDDEHSINDLVVMNLKLAGYECLQAFDGAQAVRMARAENPDLIVLDVMLPVYDGFTLMEKRMFGDIPVIYLSAKDQITDKVRSLTVGADDYLVKPFEAAELLARVDSVLRRAAKHHRIYMFSGTCIDLDERTTTVDGKPVKLTCREFELLAALIRHQNLALSREQLLNLAWGEDYLGETRTVDVHITKLRKKLHLEDYIKTVYKLGYRLEAPR